MKMLLLNYFLHNYKNIHYTYVDPGAKPACARYAMTFKDFQKTGGGYYACHQHFDIAFFDKKGLPYSTLFHK